MLGTCTARRAELLALALLLALPACQSERSTWTHASVDRRSEDESWSRYDIAHYDPLADVCVAFSVSDDRRWSLELAEASEIEVLLLGVEGHSLTFARGVEAWEGDIDAAERCSSGGGYSEIVVAKGKVRLSDFSNTLFPETACKISYELEVENVNPWAEGDEMRTGPYFASARKHPIATLGCPQPKEYVVEYTDPDAAYANYEGFDNLVLAQWDEARQVCAWARFVRDEDGHFSPNQVQAPGDWVYTGLRLQRITQAECVAAKLMVPGDYGYTAGGIYAPLDSIGSLSFAARDGEVPCRLNLDLELESPGEYYWMPDELVFRSQGLPVSGACVGQG